MSEHQKVMGIILHEKIDTGLGFEMVDTYASFSGQEVRITPFLDPISGEKKFQLASRYVVFKDKQASIDRKKAIITTTIRIVTDANGIQNVYSELYAKLKERFPNSEDA